jgi:hypothetical protein
MGGLGAVYGPRSMRRFCRRKKFQTPGSFNFQIDNVCRPGETLLWDLIQDDKIVSAEVSTPSLLVLFFEVFSTM